MLPFVMFKSKDKNDIKINQPLKIRELLDTQYMGINLHNIP